MIRDSKLCIYLSFVFLSACTLSGIKQEGPQPPVPPASLTEHTESRSLLSTPITPLAENLGEQAQRQLRSRYADTRANCGADTLPAFLCSGILIRGTASNPAFHVWNNSAASQAKGGVSFSYLRKDTNYRQSGYTNGYIFLPYRYAGAKIRPEIFCSFPLNAVTSARPEAGCGASPGVANSGSCETVGIVTAAQWWARYGGPSISQQQCGFNVRDVRDQYAGPAFDASIKVRVNFNDAQMASHNELIIRAWQDNLGRTLPLEAFFYLTGTTGLQDAQRNQRDLKTTDGVVIPIISIRLARNATDTATFYFFAADQVETMPPARP